MQTTTGRASSTSAPNTSVPDSGDTGFLDEGSHAHKGTHFTLTVWPNGRAILTTVDHLTVEQFEMIQGLFEQWMETGHTRPLVIANCRVVMNPVPLTDVDVRVGT